MHENLPPLDVLVLTYNHENFIADCLKSILECNYENMRIWVLDDESSDSTYKIINDLAQQSDKIVPLTQPQSGGKTAQNTQRLIDETQSEYIMLLSGDDLLGPAFSIKDTISKLQKQPNLAAVFPRMLWMADDPRQQVDFTYTPQFYDVLKSGNPDRILNEHLYKRVSQIFLQGIIIRRTTIEAMGGFEIGLLADDYAFIFRLFNYLSKNNMSFYFNENNFWIYRIHKEGIHRIVLRQFCLIIEVIAKYLPKEKLNNFKYDNFLFSSHKEFCDAYEFCKHLLGDAQTRRIMRIMAKKMFNNARDNKNKSLLADISKDKRIGIKYRIKSRLSLLKVMIFK